MAKQVINTGTVPDDGTGDTLRNAFVKANANFTELYDNFSNTDLILTASGGTLTGAFDSPDVPMHKLRFLADTLSDLPSASTYHGMFAHVHSEGHGYFAHNGSWTQLLDTTSTLLDLGISDGAAGQVLTTDGSGAFTFEDGGGIGLSSRATKAGTTSSLADDASANLDITGGYKAYALLAIEVDRAAWVRVYTHNAARSADTSRVQTEDPAPGSGVIAEVITTGAEVIQISPGTIGYSFEATPGTTIPCRVTNLSGSSSTVEVTLTAIQLEA